ncbi:MAG: hypothetical protein RL077_5879 [Verrucomicrobiota bacterium]|jgi:hypothetical protein
MKIGGCFALAILVAALGLQFVRLPHLEAGDTQTATKQVNLAGRLPKAIAGWESTDEPLGPTEFLRTAVEKTLNYDDMVNRVYRQGERSVGLYVAYWSPGRMPVQKVASHTPDRCWSENGWTCEAMRIDDQLKAGDRRLLPARWRLFRPPVAGGPKQYVIYWHLVGGELYDYGDRFNQRPDPLKWWRDTVHYALKGSSEQYFIRIMSSQPLEEFQADPGFQEVLGALAKLGLGVPPTKADGG